MGAGSLALILLLKPFKRLPGILIAVVLATLAVSVFNLDQMGVKVLGQLPQGLPGFVFPWVSDIDLVEVLLGGIAVALVSFADTSVLSRSYAARLKMRVNPNQEMFGLGVANLASGLFQGIPISSSSSRTPVAEAAGSQTQLTGIIGALAVTLLLLVAPNLMQHLPNSALAAVVIAAALGLFEFADLKRIFRMQQWEFWLSFTCFVGVAVFGAIPGICIAVVVSVIEFLWDGWRPHHAVLGRADGLRGYHDMQRYPQARRIPGLVLLRWDAPLFFANAEQFQHTVMAAVDASPTPVQRVVIAAEPVTSIDITSADMLAELDRALEARGVELQFAEMKDPVKDKMRQFELFEHMGEKAFHPTVGAAVDAYLEESGVDWQPEWPGGAGLTAKKPAPPPKPVNPDQHGAGIHRHRQKQRHTHRKCLVHILPTCTVLHRLPQQDQHGRQATDPVRRALPARHRLVQAPSLPEGEQQYPQKKNIHR